MTPILFGLGSALSWGAADFSGGIASRKTGAYHTVLYAEVVGLILLLFPLLFVSPTLPSWKALALGLAAGMAGTSGLLLLYHSMTRGLMSIAASVSAVWAAILPVGVGMILEGLPHWPTFVGFGLALLAIGLISRGEGEVRVRFSSLRLPLLAGFGFGFYFVLMHAASQDALWWPIAAARFGGLLLIAAYFLVTHAAWGVNPAAWRAILLNSVFDVCGNGFFILAAQSGRLDVASVLGSLYPGSTVMLAWLFLKERLSPSQWAGIFSALLAIVLMTM